MKLSLEKATKLRDALNLKLRGDGFKSYSKMTSLKADDGFYDVRVVLHPDEDSLPFSLKSLQTSPWPGISGGSEYIKRTPRTPSKRDSPFDDFYPSAARRTTEPSIHYPDVNPNYPGMRRVPDIQDLVRRVAMKNSDLSSRLARVGRVISLQDRLHKIARAGHGYHKESEFLVEELLSYLKGEGHTGRHKVVRVVKSLMSAMKSDGYSFEK